MQANSIVLTYLTHFFLGWQMFHKNVLEEIKIHILYSITFFRKSALYEIMWKNTEQPDTPQTTTWHVRIACWIPMDRNARSEYVIITALPLQQWLHKRASKLCYTHIVCLVIYTLGPLQSAVVPATRERGRIGRWNFVMACGWRVKSRILTYVRICSDER